MIAEPKIVGELLVQIEQLSAENRIRLIQRISETLIPAETDSSTFLQYGKYSSQKESTLEDFAVAEWHPQDDLTSGS